MGFSDSILHLLYSSRRVLVITTVKHNTWKGL
jgi:hypothetical protein